MGVYTTYGYTLAIHHSDKRYGIYQNYRIFIELYLE